MFQSDYLAVQVSWDCSNDKINHDEKVETLLLSSNTEFKISTLTFVNLIDRVNDFTWYISMKALAGLCDVSDVCKLK